MQLTTVGILSILSEWISYDYVSLYFNMIYSVVNAFVLSGDITVVMGIY